MRNSEMRFGRGGAERDDIPGLAGTSSHPDAPLSLIGFYYPEISRSNPWTFILIGYNIRSRFNSVETFNY